MPPTMENEGQDSGGNDWTTDRNAYTTSASAIESNSIPDLQKSLALARDFFDDDEYAQFREEVFRDILSYNSMDLLLYMLDYERIPITMVTPNSIFQWASKSLIDALTSRGWDVDAMDPPAFNGKRLLDYFVRERYGKEDLARWLVQEKGATVTSRGSCPPSDRDVMRTPLLETCAAFGTVSMLTFLEREGANPTSRMLHVAVEVAAGRGVDPDSDLSQQPQDRHDRSVEMLHYLVIKRQMSVNAIDTDVCPKGGTDIYWGTPICYAARCSKGAQVVRWLLKKGADPTIRSTCSGMDAIACAREAKCDEIVSILEDWRGERYKNEV
ncbi:hypothetical protein F5B22DRAFT_624841 [Xylaria bambusicola]|uniref:uncharacterized protein n=1 Tax=Xylaria bambusicola TaxID=326684 RepID=UPI002007E9C1|nr:uncharacterized protein F5B22DRAFT_624841 [Xylaria bambusicola]KAI0506249.1 hypothetical protein F5B22DRAFT_624841 [Xylaria bambusicola]